MLHVAPTNALNVSPVMSISRIDIVSHMCVCGAPIPASYFSRPSSSPLPRTVTFMSKKMLRASCRSSTPFLLQLSLDSLPAAFASIHPCRRLSLGHICSLFLHRVHRLWCTVRLVYHPSHLAALLVLACLGLSSPCSPSLSLSPSLFLSLSLSQLYFIASFSLYMASLIYALHSPSNLPLSSFSATADLTTVLKVSAHRTPVTSHGAKI